MKTSYLIGEQYKNNLGNKFTVVGYTDSNRKRRIKFESGCEYDVLVSQIRNGKATDYKAKTYYGIACCGFKNATAHPLFYRWTNMIRRCYDKKMSGYKSYGGKGVFVSDELLDFENYIAVVKKLPNYNSLKQNPTEWDIDKDLKSTEKQYARDTLTIMRKHKNLELENRTKKIKVQQFDPDGRLLNTFESISEAEIKTGVHRGNISRSTRKPHNKAGGYIWRNYYHTGI